MAKKKAGQQQQFTDPETGEEFGDAIPELVQERVDAYVRCLRDRNKATEKLNTAKEACIESMKEHGIQRVRIDEGAKWLEVTDEPKLRTRKIKEETGEESETAWPQPCGAGRIVRPAPLRRLNLTCGGAP